MASCFFFDFSQAECWHEYLKRISDSDIYFTPEYCKIYEENGEGSARLFVYDEGERFVYYPFLLRRINGLPLFRSWKLDRDYYDIQTPYGYGGPLSNAPAEERGELFARFGEAFGRFCREKGIVTEFVRFHPLLRNHDDYSAVEGQFVRNTIYIDLRMDIDQLLEQYRPDTRNRVRKSLREGLSVVQSEPERLDFLNELYHATMIRTGASDYYFFPRRFFDNTVSLLKGHIGLMEVMHEGRSINSCLFMYSNRFAHYHLSGNDKEFSRLAPNNALLHAAACWAKEIGCEFLHLGGGYKGNDELFRFKSGFNKNGVLDFYVGKKIHFPELYNQVTGGMTQSLGDSDFFPLYRHPQLIQAEPLEGVEAC